MKAPGSRGWSATALLWLAQAVAAGAQPYDLIADLIAIKGGAEWASAEAGLAE